VLKRGKNRPSMAVMLAEAKAQQGIAKTFGRQVSMRVAARCPFPKCSSSPDPLFCATHWVLLDSLMRRELLAELRSMRDRAQSAPTTKLKELFRLAIRDMQRELAAREPGSTTVLHMPATTIEKLKNELREAEQRQSADAKPPVSPG
jgi:hypothetical protein